MNKTSLFIIILLIIGICAGVILKNKILPSIVANVPTPTQVRHISPTPTIATIPTNNPTASENIAQPGEHCGGFIRNAKQCSPGYHCQLNHIPDTGGTCVAN